MTTTKTKTIRTVAFGAATAMAFGASAQAATLFTAEIEESQSTTPGDAMGVFAGASLTLNQTEDGGYDLAMSITFTDGIDWSGVVDSGQIDVSGEDVTDGGVDATRFHIHNAPRGEAGGVVFGIFDLVAPEAVADVNGDTLLQFNDDGSAVLSTVWNGEEGTGDAMLMDFVTEFLAAGENEDIAFYFNFHTTDAPAGLIRGQIVGQNAAAVPIPGAALLFVPALAGGALMRRRRRAS